MECTSRSEALGSTTASVGIETPMLSDNLLLFLSHQLPKTSGIIAIEASMQMNGAMLQRGNVMLRKPSTGRGENLKSNESCISNPKLEISDWTSRSARKRR